MTSRHALQISAGVFVLTSLLACTGDPTHPFYKPRLVPGVLECSPDLDCPGDDLVPEEYGDGTWFCDTDTPNPETGAVGHCCIRGNMSHPNCRVKPPGDVGKPCSPQMPEMCISKVCGPDNRCAMPTCQDKVPNGIETGVDCGGNCDKCAQLQGCHFGSDCQSGICSINSASALGICLGGLDAMCLLNSHCASGRCTVNSGMVPGKCVSPEGQPCTTTSQCDQSDKLNRLRCGSQGTCELDCIYLEPAGGLPGETCGPDPGEGPTDMPNPQRCKPATKGKCPAGTKGCVHNGVPVDGSCLSSKCDTDKDQCM